MSQLIFLFSLLLPIFSYVSAQPSSDQNNQISQPTANTFAPSIAVVIIIVAITFLLTILASMYAKFCYRVGTVYDNQHIPHGFLRMSPRSSGIDKIAIDSLPFFKFSALKGLRGGLECAVCLSKFEDIEVLRLLPKCKHAFHINCVDQWLENHSSCPLCRQRISVDDLTCSNSSRFLSSQSEVRGESNLELFVQREDSCRQGSSRFGFGRSLKKFEKGVVKDDEILPIREDENNKSLHKFNHKIIMSNAVLKSRWSNLSSSDLLYLNSEMLGDVSSNRFSPLNSTTQDNSRILKIKDDTGRKSDFEMKFGKSSQDDLSCPSSSGANTSNPTRDLHPNEKRSMSEIVVHSRFDDSKRTNSFRESSVPENAVEEKRLKRLWFPIARKTVQWYANRDKKSRQSLNV